jgi:hypothetical protein
LIFSAAVSSNSFLSQHIPNRIVVSAAGQIKAGQSARTCHSSLASLVRADHNEPCSNLRIELMKRILKFAGFALITWICCLNGARAQAPQHHGPTPEDRNRSHVPIVLNGTDFNQALQQRFANLRQTAEERERWMQDAKKMADKFLKNPQDPEIERMAKDLIQKEHGNDWLKEELNAQKKAIPPEKFKEYEETLKRFQEESMGKSATGPESPSSQETGAQDPSKNNVPREKSSGPHAKEGTSTDPSLGPRPGVQPPLPSEQSTPEEKLARWLRNNLDVHKGPLAESPAVQEALREFRRARSSAEPLADDNSWAGRFARFNQSLVKNDFWSKMEMPSLGKWQRSNGSLPKLRSPLATPSLGEMPRVGMPSAKAVDRGLQVLWVGLILAAGLLVWKLLGGQVPGMKRQTRRDWKLGPWPVAPGDVGTRQDIVRAFEYLSLLKLGPAAQSRNHVELAAELGELESERSRAAERLAGIYEKARYMPANEALPLTAVVAARRELCQLAGFKQV